MWHGRRMGNAVLSAGSGASADLTRCWVTHTPHVTPIQSFGFPAARSWCRMGLLFDCTSGERHAAHIAILQH